jgi:hypothetical protein
MTNTGIDAAIAVHEAAAGTFAGYAYANYDNCWVWDGYQWANVCYQSYAWY